MKNTKNFNIVSRAIVLCLLAILVLYVVQAGTNPSAPTTISVDANSTSSYPNGTSLNTTRGFIYNITINESQPSQKWIGYVGNINGEYALQNANGSSLYDWAIVTIKGELYATAETVQACTGGGSDFEDSCRFGGGIPSWTGMKCANESMIDQEDSIYDHNDVDEDAYNRTFLNGSSFANAGFYAGETLVNDVAVGSGDCFGIYLNQNNADQSAHWNQSVLTDQTSHDRTSGDGTDVYDIIYSVILENNTAGYDGSVYDFQIMLPQNGSAAAPSNIAFYFYVELI